MLRKGHTTSLGCIVRDQVGAILPLAIIASFLSLAVVVPTAVMVGTAALRQGGFEDAPFLPVGPNPYSTTTGDFNEDGHLDLVVAHRDNTETWVLHM